jgi:hypothetical protein
MKRWRGGGSRPTCGAALPTAVAIEYRKSVPTGRCSSCWTSSAKTRATLRARPRARCDLTKRGRGEQRRRDQRCGPPATTDAS